MELRQLGTLRLFSQPIRSGSASAGPVDAVELGRDFPPAPDQPPVQRAQERHGPLQGSMLYLMGRSQWENPDPGEVSQALGTVRRELAEGPLPEPTVRRLLTLAQVKRGPVAEGASELLRDWCRSGRLPVVKAGQPLAEIPPELDFGSPFARVEDGQLHLGVPPRFSHAYVRERDPQKARQILADAIESLRVSRCAQTDLLELLKKPETAEALKPFSTELIMSARRQLEAGADGSRHTLVLSATLNAFPDQDKTLMAEALGPLLRQGLDPASVARHAARYLGGSWLIEQLAQRDPLLPGPGLALLQAHGRWNPEREDVGRLVGMLQVPAEESVLHGSAERTVKEAVGLLATAPPEMLEGWTVGGRDFRETLLERLISDRPPASRENSALFGLLPYYPYRHDASGFVSKSLGDVLFGGPRGEERRERALSDLREGLRDVPPGAALPAREKLLTAVLLGSRQGRAFDERLLETLAPHMEAGSQDPGSEKVLAHLRRQAFWHELQDLSPRETLGRAWDTSRQQIEPSGLDRCLLRRWADHVSADPLKELPQALHALSDASYCQRVRPLFEQALSAGRLSEAFAMLNQAVEAAGAGNGPDLFLRAGLDRLAFHQELSGYAEVRAIFQSGDLMDRDLAEVHQELGQKGPRRPAYTEAARFVWPLVDQSDCRGIVSKLEPIVGDLEGPALTERLERFRQLNEIQFFTLDDPQVFLAIEATPDPARALRSYRRLDEAVGYEHTERVFQTALATGTDLEALDELLRLHQSLRPDQPPAELAEAFEQSCRRLAEGESLRSVRHGLAGVGGVPQPGAGIEDAGAAVRLPGVMLRKRS